MSQLPIATITMQDGGVITCELYPDTAPISVANFADLANTGFYDGKVFHRCIPGFMIQGGSSDGTGAGRMPFTIKGEFASNGVPNGVKHIAGVLSMARTNVPNSASSQFFIMHKAAPHLDGQYAAFGKVTQGMDVVDRIATTPTKGQDVPVTPQIIKSIRVEAGETALPAVQRIG